MKNKTQWSELDTNTVKQFANGLISGSEFYRRNANTPTGGIVRNLLREYGVKRARQLAKRATR